MGNEYYNEDMKFEFINKMIETNKSYISAYQRLFEMTAPFEMIHNKDLSMFDSKDLLMVFKSISHNIKYTTVMTYNSLVGNYKDWLVGIGGKVLGGVCTVDELKTIKNYKKYVIFNEDDILNITERLPMDGADYNIALFIGLFWQIDGQESHKDVLKLRVQDIDFDNDIIRIYNSKTNKYNEYKINSRWLMESLYEYANMTSLEFANKNGSYAIKTAEENNGYIFRMTYTRRTKVGEPIDGVKFSNTLYQFCERRLTDVITINDILMSLALRDMVANKKSPAEMYTQKKYFANLPSSVYANVFVDNAHNKYPNKAEQYIEYFKNLQKKLETLA
jgi:integrase